MITSMERGKHLHARACKGDSLTKAEREELEAWYKAMAEQESKSLNIELDMPSADDLQAQLNEELASFERTVKRLKKLHETNEKLRKEIRTHKRRLVEEKAGTG